MTKTLQIDVRGLTHAQKKLIWGHFYRADQAEVNYRNCDSTDKAYHVYPEGSVYAGGISRTPGTMQTDAKFFSEMLIPKFKTVEVFDGFVEPPEVLIIKGHRYRRCDLQ